MRSPDILAAHSSLAGRRSSPEWLTGAIPGHSRLCIWAERRVHVCAASPMCNAAVGKRGASAKGQEDSALGAQIKPGSALNQTSLFFSRVIFALLCCSKAHFGICHRCHLLFRTTLPSSFPRFHVYFIFAWQPLLYFSLLLLKGAVFPLTRN